MPGIPGLVITAYPTRNNETAEDIAAHLLEGQRACSSAGLRLLSVGADGAHAEHGSQSKFRYSPNTTSRMEYKVQLGSVPSRFLS